MAAIKSRTSIWSGQVLTAGAANTPSPWIDLSAAYGAQLDIRLTNGTSGPTVAAQVQILVAAAYNSGSPVLPTSFGGAFVGGTGNGEVDYLSAEIPIGVAAVQLVAGSNTGQNVAVDADISIVIGV